MNPRPTNRGLIYLRRSGDRQETSLEKQLTWAVHAAQQHHVCVDATMADLAHMRAHRLQANKSLRLDDAITGGDLERPGLTALIRDSVNDTTISHVFAFNRSRLGRPDNPVEMMIKEVELLQHGITLIFSDGESRPQPGGESDIGDQIKALIDYHMSGKFRRELAEQMVNTQLLLARDGHSTGGTPPYGFVRALVDAQGKVLEILPKGKRVRQLGCHVVWVPDPSDDSKLRTWIQILTLKEAGWGYKRIANHLSYDLKIPSPAAGTTRTDHGVAHQVSGVWAPNTVRALCENRTLLAIFDYGRRSEGKVRRLDEHGPRVLEDSDLDKNGKPKVIMNDLSRVRSVQRTFEPHFDPDRWENIRQQTRRRGRSQAGIPRASDPAKYPLSCRVVDLSDDCQSIMYARTSGQRKVYQCGRYMNSGGKACNNNQVDAEALLRFALETLRELTGRFASRDALRAKLLERARQESGELERTPAEFHRTELEARAEQLEQDLAKVQRNLALEEDTELREAIRAEYRRMKEELTAAKRELAELTPPRSTHASPEEEVDQALALFDDIQRIAADPQARAEVPRLLERLGLWIGLTFIEGIKGKKRRVRRLAGGVIGLGQMPVRGAVATDAVTDASTASVEDVEANETADRMVRSASCRREGISFTKVNRGDRI